MIIFDNVTKQFGDDAYALRDVSFTIEPGEFVFLTGPSGSGKTTVMRLLTREYIPTSGAISFDGVDLHDMKTKDVYHHRRQIGVIFQDYKLLPDANVWENIALPLYIVGKSNAEIESRVTDLLKLVNLVDKAYLFPSQLSGGEAQRVSIARALATGPKVIFADEPTGNLDPETSITIAKLLHKINQLGTTVLLATHDTGVLAALDSIRRLKLEKGVLVDDSAPKAKRHKPTEPVEKTEPKPEPVKKQKSAHSEPKAEKKSETNTPDTSETPEKETKPKKGWPSFGWKKKSPKEAESAEHVDVSVESLEEEPTKKS